MNKKEFGRAIEIAQSEYPRLAELDNPSYFHWTFVYQHNRLLDWATNRKTESCKRFGYKTGRRYDHAEPRAIRKAWGLLDKRKRFHVFNVRLGADRQPRLARPCEICHGFLNAIGCHSCYYTDGTGVSNVIY